jgi:alkylhydroperoxidase family enzyme
VPEPPRAARPPGRDHADLAEALTRLDEDTDLDALAEAASEHLSRAQIAAVQWTTTLINAFNRISIASGHPALTVKE